MSKTVKADVLTEAPEKVFEKHKFSSSKKESGGAKSKQDLHSSSFSDYLKNSNFNSSALVGGMSNQSSGALLSSSLFSSTTSEPGQKDKTLSLLSEENERNYELRKKEQRELANKEDAKRGRDSSVDPHKEGELRGPEDSDHKNRENRSQYDSEKKQNYVDDAHAKKSVKKTRGEKNKDSLEGQKFLHGENAGQRVIQDQKEALAKELEAALKEKAAKGELKPDDKKGSENLEAKQNAKKEIQETETLLRVALDPEKWTVQRAQNLEGKGKAGENPFDLKTGKDLQIKNSGKGQKEEGGAGNGEGRSGHPQSIEELSLLFAKEGEGTRQNSSIKSFQNQIQKENFLKETRRLYDNLVQKAKVNLKSDGSSSTSISLRPRSLGSMTLNIEIFQKQVQAKIVVESQAVKQILLDELNYFQQELNRQGIQVENLSIRVRENAESQIASEQEKDKSENLFGEEKGEEGARPQGREEDHSQQEQENFQLSEEEEDDLGLESASVLSNSAEEYEASSFSLFEGRNEKGIDISV